MTKRLLVKRKRTEKPNFRLFSFEYYFEKHNEKVRVCKAFFLATLCISQKPVYNVHTKKSDSGTAQSIQRGKNITYKISKEAKNRIQQHIESFPYVEAYYCRENYLEPSLNVQKMDKAKQKRRRGRVKIKEKEFKEELPEEIKVKVEIEEEEFKEELPEETRVKEEIEEEEEDEYKEEPPEEAVLKFACELCDEKILSSLDFALHSVKHSQDQKHHCHHCDGRSYKRVNAIHHHMRWVHGGMGKYMPCEVCKTIFPEWIQALEHKNFDSGEMPYHCEECDKYFMFSWLLRTHYRLFHPKSKVPAALPRYYGI
ncbi:zinc finger protein 90-like [Diabrotica virgifera virgifera]|uniref:C2H2-type domain-containing protein n=1 Tax=Diabrotica virgifera virgifera TaxID=50390 RepID=A0ABM5L327_DIAVI|nr:zinc finger protein 90-like [Diabrotica virgifera virgifera]